MTEKILAVDDEPDMLLLLSKIVREKTPYQLITTNNPLEAAEIVRNGGISVVVADLKMPGMDGTELLDAVRATSEDIPVIIMTAFATEEAAVETMAKGCFDFIIKPFRKEQIMTTLDRAVKWAAMQKENRELRRKLENQAG